MEDSTDRANRLASIMLELSVDDRRQLADLLARLIQRQALQIRHGTNAPAAPVEGRPALRVLKHA